MPPSNINLPPIKAYSTRQEALDDVNQWAFSRGYALSNAPSKKKKGSGRVKAIFGYVLREPALQPGPKKDKGKGHNKSSSGTACKYSVIYIQSLDQRTWEIKYREPWTDPKTSLVTDFSTYNHPPITKEGSEFSVQRRRLLQEEKRLVVLQQHSSRTKPRNILHYLHDHLDDDILTAQDICNEIRQINRN